MMTPLAARLHMGDDRLGAEEGAFHVDIDDAIPVFFAARFKGRIDQVAGVVDEDVELAELVERAARAGED